MKRSGRRATLTVSIVLFLLAAAGYGASVVCQFLSPVAEAGGRLTRDLDFARLETYLVSMSSSGDAAAARMESAKYVCRGGAGYVLPREGAFLAIGAGYDDMDSAERASARLSQNESLQCDIIALRADGLSLRVSAKLAQIEAFSALEAALRARSSELNALAAALDRQSVTRSQARRAAAGILERFEACLAAFDAAECSDGGGPADALRRVAADFSASLCGLIAAESKSGLDFSARLKYTYIDARTAHVEYLRALSRKGDMLEDTGDTDLP